MSNSTEQPLKTIDNHDREEVLFDLTLHIKDQLVIKYLRDFDEGLREAKAIEALKVGVIAIQSAAPTLDTRLVEEKFRDVEKKIDDYTTTFKNEIKLHLENYFKEHSGVLPRSLEKLFGESGSVTTMFSQYFSPSDGKLARVIQDHVGPASQFAKSIDPMNKEGVICRIEDVVKKHLEQRLSEIVDEFSLDVEDSAIARLKASLAKEVQDIKNANNNFFVELKEALGIKAATKQEADKGTEKGREFETVLYDYFAKLGHYLEDSTENVRGIIGISPRSKKGDYIALLGATSGAPGSKIVVEAKKEQGYKLKDALDELKEAKENRGAAIGIFAFAKGYEPPEVGDFLFMGNDFFITVDEDSIEESRPLLYLEAAYKIGRAIIVTASRKDESRELDFDQIRREISSLIELVTRLADLATKAKTINNNSKAIEETIIQLKIDMESRLKNVSDILSRKIGRAAN